MRGILVPHHPVRTRVRPDRPVSRLLDELRAGLEGPRVAVPAAPTSFVPRIDVRESEEGFTVVAELPGLAEEDFEVVLQEDVLTLKGEKRPPAEAEGVRHRCAETLAGRFERRVRFDAPIDRDALKAVYRQGVLTVTVPKAEEPKPKVRQVPIQTA